MQEWSDLGCSCFNSESMISSKHECLIQHVDIDMIMLKQTKRIE